MDDVKNATSDLIAQVTTELQKSERESVKGKLKEILKKRKEAEKTIALLDAEAQKVVSDFEAGVA